MKKRILTGDRATGFLHIGHLVGSLQNRVKLQDEYDQFVMIANVQSLSDNFDNPEKVASSMGELLCDYYAVGIDYEKTTVFIQSEVPAIHEIFVYLMNFVSLQQLSHNPTIKQEIKDKNFETSTPLGFFVYPIHQVADITFIKADLVPVGRDQAPMIEDAREIARKFNNTYGVSVLKEPEGLYGVEKNLVGTDGNSKMSKSFGNTINLVDSEDELREKIKKMKTDPNRIRATDPGQVEGNPLFIYHDTFNENVDEVNELKARYRAGTVGDVEAKDRLFEAMNRMLTPIRERRKEAEGKRAQLFEAALEGSRRAAEIGRETAAEMKEAMKIKF